MRTLNSIILGLLISSQAFAGLPPTTVKGQNDSAASVTFNLQVPESQSTRVNGTTALIETGNGNLLGNPGAEGSTLLFATYADAAATTPADMDGAGAGTTIARSSSTPLKGSYSYVMDLGAGSSRQGEGIVTSTISVPYGQRGLQHAFRALFEATGAITDGDIVAYAYDITNTALLAPTYVPGKLLGSKGEFVALFDIPSTCAQLRIGFHVARTATTALSLKFDDLKLVRENVVTGLNGSNTQSVSMTPSAGFGTVSGAGYTMHVKGDRAYFEGRFVTGTVAASTASIDLPTGMNIDTAKMTSTASNGVIVGAFQHPPTGATSALGERVVIFDGSDTNTVFFTYRGGTNALNKENGSTLFESSQLVTFKFDVPIAGLDANLTLAQSSTFKISSYLANGTRVTATPTALGEYRSYLRDAGAFTFTETNGTPTATPSATNGMRIYTGNAFGSADTSGEPTRYEIFVGKNKHVKTVWYSTTGRTGTVDVRPHVQDSTATVGYFEHYDETTGIYTISANRQLGGSTAHVAGFVAGTGGASSVADPYFDITVSENALAVGIDPDVSARYSSSAGQSISTATSTIVDFGTKTYDSHNAVTTGAAWKFTAPQSGKYSVKVLACWANTGFTSGTLVEGYIFKNGVVYAALDQTTVTATTTQRPKVNGGDEIFLNTGDYIDIRVQQNDGGGRNLESDAKNVHVSITKVSN